MPEIMSNPASGTPCWVDLGVPDAVLARRFYHALFGWDYREGGEEFAQYLTAMKNGRKVAGIMGGQELHNSWWCLYFAVDDCDRAVLRSVEAGAEIIAPTVDVGPLGRTALLSDPQGAWFGFWEGHRHVGSELVNEPGSFIWNELITTDTAKAADFYSAALRAAVTPMKEGFDHLTVDIEGHPVCGLYGASPEQVKAAQGGKAAWKTYFAVENAEDAARTAEAEGGRVVQGVTGSPYGRFVVILDPFGAEFAALEPPSAQ
ncbi:VOC family protein [Actinocorallia sp. B10E7]|uniref:VOC family protein n=1 Tax=Actinocorallia sp. B10E7 TaxID=3153558 RepID=UPI00325F11E2